jgi:hypothetical protein
MFSELCSKSNETEYTACHEWKNGVGAINDVIDAKTFTDDNICWVANEKDHASCIRSSELGNKPRHRIEPGSIGVISEEGSARKDDRVIANNHADCC